MTKVYYATEFTPGSNKPAPEDLVQPHRESFLCVASKDHDAMIAENDELRETCATLISIVIKLDPPWKYVETIQAAQRLVRGER
jgi:hypothetical protein